MLVPRAGGRGIIFGNNLKKDTMCLSDAAGLLIIFSNLLENAVEYTNNGGRIWVTSQQKNGAIEIVFENTGSQLTDEEVRMVFDSYWRADTARSRANLHFGLGLGLARRVAGVLGGKMRVASVIFQAHVCLLNKTKSV